MREKCRWAIFRFVKLQKCHFKLACCVSAFFLLWHVVEIILQTILVDGEELTAEEDTTNEI